jgi:hypothetical protein
MAFSSLATAAAVVELVGVSEDARCAFRYSMTDATLHINGIKIGSEVEAGAAIDVEWL